MLERRRGSRQVLPKNPGLLRRGKFSDYAKKQGASFTRPGAMLPKEFLGKPLFSEPEESPEKQPPKHIENSEKTVEEEEA